MVKSDFTLQEAWNSAFAVLPREISTVMCHMEWSGDAQRIQGALGYTAQELARIYTAYCRSKSLVLEYAGVIRIV